MEFRRYVLLAILVLLLIGLVDIGIMRGQQGAVQQPQASQSTLVGTAFTYQGFLNDAGVPANGAYDFHFQLFDAESDGNQIGSTVTVNDHPIVDGQFTVWLDFGSEVFGGAALFLQLNVRPGADSGDYTTLTPRQPIGPTPYALALPGLYTEQNATSPNLVGGSSDNLVAGGAVGATIGGGGEAAARNEVADS